MKINQIKINSYGKIKNKNIDLKKINIIYGKNESGKSTLLNFIINIFYNISKNKNGKDISDFEKYLPWDEGEFSGKINYELDNNKKYEVFRNFNKKNPEIYDENGKEIADEFNVDKKSGNLFFLDQVKIDRETLLSTVVASQNETKIDVGTQNLLIQKVANLAESGSEDISYKKAIAKLDKLLLTEVGTDKSQDRPINLAKENINIYASELEEIKNAEIKKYEIEENNKKILKNIKNEEKNEEIYKKINKILENNKIQEEKININKKILEENNKKIEKLNLEKNDKKIKKNKKINYFLLILLIFINIFSIFLIKNIIINILLFLLIPLFIFYILFKNKKNNNKINNLQINTLKNNNLELEKEINNLENKLNNYNTEEKNKLINLYGKEIEDLFNYKLISEIINENKNNLNNLNLEIHKLKLDMENIEPKLEKIADLEEKLYLENENLENLKNKSEIFNITKEIINEANLEMKNNVAPKFNINLSKNIEKLSNGKYKKIILNDGISVELENGQYIQAERLSTGTIEQIYLALRLSVIDEISKEKLPILLDETFAYYDKERLESALKFLKDIDNLIIIFTCTNREKEILDKLNVDYNLVEM